jgi:hypothetical protein
MSTPNSTLRQRGPKKDNKPGAQENDDAALKKALDELNQTVSNEWDYKLALGIITILAFATRFYGISHPNEVVFDEVHFGKVRSSAERGYCKKLEEYKLMVVTHSSHPTTCNAPTSSMSTLPSESCSLPWSAGWWDTTGISSSTTLASLTSQTMSPIWPSEVCRHSLELLPSW